MKYYHKSPKQFAGFTLVELLVSMTIIMVLGSVILTVFFSALRGTEKSQSLISLRQNGNFALSQMAKTIRTAENAVCQINPETGYEELELTSSVDHEVTTILCDIDGNIASQSANQTYYFLDTGSSFQASACTFSCDTDVNSNIPSVTATFTLTPFGPSATPSSGDGSHFTTTVLLRNAIGL